MKDVLMTRPRKGVNDGVFLSSRLAYDRASWWWPFTLKSITFITLVSLIFAPLPFNSRQVEAAFNSQINYQAKLTDSGGVTVADGSYIMKFRLYTSATGATTTNIWEEIRTATGDRAAVTNGLFSLMLGSSTALTSVDFNQTLYLGVEVCGTVSLAGCDGEMSPRKILGAIPAAFEASKLSGLATSSFLRSDAVNSTTTSTTFVTINQSGTGNILDLQDGGTTVFTVRDGGNVGIGTTSPYAKLSVVGEIVAAYFTATSTTATSTFAGVFSVGSSTPAANAMFSVGTSSQLLFVNKTSGAVGIGTTSPTEQLAVAGRLYVGGTGTSTFENNLHVDGTLQVGTGSVYLGDTFVNASNGAFSLRTNASSTFGTNGFTIGTNQFVVQQTSGNVGLGTTSPYAKLSVVGETVAANFTATSTTALSRFLGRVLVGDNSTTTMQLSFFPFNPTLMINNTESLSGVGLAVNRAGDNTTGNLIVGAKSRGTFAAPAVVADGDEILKLDAWARGDTSFRQGGFIQFNVDTGGGTPSETNLPTNIIFSTNTFDQNSPIERMRIDRLGHVTINDSAFSQPLSVFTSRGTTTGSTGYAGIFENSDNTSLLSIRNDGQVTANQFYSTNNHQSYSWYDDDLVAYYPFSETGGTVFYDRSRNGNTLTEPSSLEYPFPSILGNAISFNGTTDYLSAADNASLEPTTFTITFWMKSSQLTGAVLVEKDDDNGYSVQRGSDNSIILKVGGITTATSTNKLASVDGVWHYIAVINRSISPPDQIFIDGVDNTDTSSNTTGTPSYGSGNLVIGSRAGSMSYGGNLDEVRIYSRVLSNSEIRDQYLSGLDSTQKPYVTTAGNVGIGTTSPFARLSIAGGPGSTTPLFAVSTSTAGFATTTTFIIDQNGKVGIGTTSPSAQLALSGLLYVGGTGTSTFENNLHVDGTLQVGTGSIYLGDTFVNAGNGAFSFLTTATSTFGTSGFTIGTSQFVVQQTSGNVGLGTTSPYAKLSVVGETVSTYFTATSTTATSTFAGVLSVGSSTPASNALFIVGTSTPLLFVNKNTGNVGIGTTTIPSTLTIQGSLCVINSSTTGCNTTNGTISATNVVVQQADLAEYYPVTDETIAAGEIVAVDPINSVAVKRAALGETIIGIISTKPGFTLGQNASGRPVALAGRVPVKVTAEGGAIQTGDRITLSSTPGVGMKATTSGYTVGIALEPFTGQNGEPGLISAYVNLGWSKLDTVIAGGTISGSLWTLEEGTGRIVAAGPVDLRGSTLYNTGAITSASGGWSMDESGRLLVQELEVGSPSRRTGITLYDETSGNPYCLKVINGNPISTNGKCDVSTLTTPGTSSTPSSAEPPLPTEPPPTPTETSSPTSTSSTPPLTEPPPPAPDPVPVPTPEPPLPEPTPPPAAPEPAP